MLTLILIRSTTIVVRAIRSGKLGFYRLASCCGDCRIVLVWTWRRCEDCVAEIAWTCVSVCAERCECHCVTTAVVCFEAQRLWYWRLGNKWFSCWILISVNQINALSRERRGPSEWTRGKTVANDCNCNTCHHPSHSPARPLFLSQSNCKGIFLCLVWFQLNGRRVDFERRDIHVYLLRGIIPIMDRLEELSNTLSNITMYDIKNMYNQVCC